MAPHLCTIAKCLILQEYIHEIVGEYYSCGLLQWIEIHVKQIYTLEHHSCNLNGDHEMLDIPILF